MKTLAGLWIDHREAVIVLVSEKGQETKRITSRVEKQLRRSGRSPTRAPFEPQMVPADDSREREYVGHLANYYDEVVSCLGTAEAIQIFGPGEAKGELRKRIERNRLDLRVTRFETADKMTERQIFQKVRRHYLPQGFDHVAREMEEAVNRRAARKSTGPNRLMHRESHLCPKCKARLTKQQWRLRRCPTCGSLARRAKDDGSLILAHEGTV
jgi:hypothetical protein